jgi:hypothetical protein
MLAASRQLCSCLSRTSATASAYTGCSSVFLILVEIGAQTESRWLLANETSTHLGSPKLIEGNKEKCLETSWIIQMRKKHYPPGLPDGIF